MTGNKTVYAFTDIPTDIKMKFKSFSILKGISPSKAFIYMVSKIWDEEGDTIIALDRPTQVRRRLGRIFRKNVSS